MKRNIVPLLGIAVVVAILSTGVFYGLFAGKLRSASPEASGQAIVVAARDLDRGTVLQASDLKVSEFKGALAGSFSSPAQLAGATVVEAIKQNEPLLEERVVSKVPKPGSAGSSVPSGLRAVSIRVSESDGLIGLLRPGAKVDLQAVQERNGGLELRTILQDVEVVAVSPQTQPAGGNRGPVSIVTVLARPEDADVVALADSGTRLRLSLRNPLDSGAEPHRALSLGSVFQANGVTPVSGPFAATDRRSLEVRLQVLRATTRALSQLEAKLARPASGTAMAVTPFADQTESRQLIEKLVGEHQVEILSERSLSAAIGRPARFRSGPASGKVGISFFTQAGKDGRLTLRVQPEISSQEKSEIATRLVDAEFPTAGSFLVSGIFNSAGDREAVERLYPGHSWSDGQLLIVFDSREESELSAARAERRR
ncbi:MAG TPA: Flp pilus assembly protein CpaB [Bryobacteraceae bacterium]|nr:Flp pilus assembly protein CpaB [Bryobacteraceae bacterium]